MKILERKEKHFFPSAKRFLKLLEIYNCISEDELYDINQ